MDSGKNRRLLAGALAVPALVLGGVSAGGIAPAVASASAPASVPASAAPSAAAWDGVDVSQLAPGTVIASSTLPREYWWDGSADAIYFTYVTEGPHGNVPATAVVYLPEGPVPDGGWPVVAWAHGTVGDSDADAPSHNIDENTIDYTDAWLDRGYAVVAADYIGMGGPGIAPYLDGTAAAHAVIDAVRGAHEVTPDLSDSWVVVGLSQGGQAAMFTGALADGYAPELDFRGTVAVGAPSNIENLLAPLAGPWFPPEGMFTRATNFMSFMFAGLRDTHPEADMDSYLTPLGKQLVDAAPHTPYPEFKEMTDGVGVNEMLSRSLNDPTLLAALRDYMGMPVSGYNEPILLVQGATDTVVPIPLTLKLVADLNLNGVHPDFQVVPGGHIESLFQSEQQAVDFVAGLFGR